MLPGVSPGAGRQGITYGVIGNGLTVVSGQQIAPALGIAVGIRNGVRGRSQSAGSIGILLAFQDITGLIVSPGMGKVSCLVILPDQLVCTVIDIAGGIRTIGDSQDITVLIIGIAECLGQSGRCYIMGSNLGRGSGAGRIVKGEGVRLDCGTAVLGSLRGIVEPSPPCPNYKVSKSPLLNFFICRMNKLLQ